MYHGGSGEMFGGDTLSLPCNPPDLTWGDEEDDRSVPKGQFESVKNDPFLPQSNLALPPHSMNVSRMVHCDV